MQSITDLFGVTEPKPKARPRRERGVSVPPDIEAGKKKRGTPANRRDRAELRRALIKVLDSSGDADLATILRKCEEPLHLTCTTCGSTKEVEAGCKKRWCPVCARKIAAQKVAKHSMAMDRMQWPLMVTLTVRSSAYAAESVRDLVKAFYDFRRTKWWKACDVKGGIRGVEITWAAGGWHPHLHLLIDCQWLAVKTKQPHWRGCREKIKAACEEAQKELCREWGQHTGIESAVCYVKRARRDALREIIKYTIDPSDLVEMGDRAAEAIRCMKGTRATQAWGSCHGIIKEWNEQEVKNAAPCQCPGCQDPQWLPTALVDTRVDWEAHTKAASVKLSASNKQRRELDLEEIADKKRRADHVEWKGLKATSGTAAIKGALPGRKYVLIGESHGAKMRRVARERIARHGPPGA